MLLYGSGLRVMECLRLRVKDIDFVRSEVPVRQGKGNKDRVTLLPVAIPADRLWSGSVLPREPRGIGHRDRDVASVSQPDDLEGNRGA